MGSLRKIFFPRNSRDAILSKLKNIPTKHFKYIGNKKSSTKNNEKANLLNSRRIGLNVCTPHHVTFSTCSTIPNQNKIGRHQFHEEIEKAINQQILTEFNASYAYLSMSAFFGRTDVALPGCQGFFYNMYLEEMEHAVVFMNYQLMRGGQVILHTIEAPEKNWGGIDKAFEAGLRFEESVKEKIILLVREAEKHHDHQLIDFLTSEYLKEQNESIQKMARFLTRARKMAQNPNGEFLFDRQLFSDYVKDKNLIFLTHLPDAEDKAYK